MKKSGVVESLTHRLMSLHPALEGFVQVVISMEGGGNGGLTVGGTIKQGLTDTMLLVQQTGSLVVPGLLLSITKSLKRNLQLLVVLLPLLLLLLLLKALLLEVEQLLLFLLLLSLLLLLLLLLLQLLLLLLLLQLLLLLFHLLSSLGVSLERKGGVVDYRLVLVCEMSKRIKWKGRIQLWIWIGRALLHGKLE